MDIKESYAIGFGIVTALACVIFFNRIKNIILYIFGGSLDKTEFAGVVFTITLIWMLHKEGNRPNEWHLYSELHIFVVAGAALTGLGLTTVLDHLKELKNSGTNSSSSEVTIKKTETKTEPNTEESESPK